LTGERKHSETFTTHDSVNALSSHCKILVIHTYLDRSKGADGVVQKYKKNQQHLESLHVSVNYWSTWQLVVFSTILFRRQLKQFIL